MESYEIKNIEYEGNKNIFLGLLIKNIRKYLNLTQKEFGEKINKSEITIRKYEAGTSNINIDLIINIILNFQINPFLFMPIFNNTLNNLNESKNFTGFKDKENKTFKQSFSTFMGILLARIEDTFCDDIEPCKSNKTDFNERYLENIKYELEISISTYIKSIIYEKNNSKNSTEIPNLDKKIKEIQTQAINYINFLIKEI